MFNGACGPVSGVWAPNKCEGDPLLGQPPGEGPTVTPFKLTYRNSHTGEYDELVISRAAIRSGEGIQLTGVVSPVQTKSEWIDSVSKTEDVRIKVVKGVSPWAAANGEACL